MPERKQWIVTECGVCEEVLDQRSIQAALATPIELLNDEARSRVQAGGGTGWRALWSIQKHSRPVGTAKAGSLPTIEIVTTSRHWALCAVNFHSRREEGQIADLFELK